MKTLLFIMSPLMACSFLQPPVVSYTHIIDEIRTGQLSRVIIGNDLKETTLVEKSGKKETVAMEPTLTTQIMKKALDYNVEVGYARDFYFPEWLLPTAFYIPFFFLGWNIFQRFYPHCDFGLEQPGNRTFDEWGGSREVLRECKETIRYFLDPNDMVKKPKGVLLEGPPGTGKTLLGRILADYANASFIAFSGSNFVELYVGMGALRVRKLFEHARKNKPCIIFIDEIDAIGQQRKQSMIGNNEEREQTLNQLLYEMDGFHKNNDILVIAATNRKDVLDNALLRPGRFDKIIHIPLPDKPSRRAIMDIFLKDKVVGEDADLDFFAGQTDGFSGADIEQWVNEACIYTLRDNNTIVGYNQLWGALERVRVGVKKDRDLRPELVKKKVAIHEAGHTLMCLCHAEYFVFQKVSIQSTYEGVGGYTMFSLAPDMDHGMITKDFMMKNVQLLLGGRLAESVFYGDDHVSVGAHDDLDQAYEMCRQMVSQFGMGKRLNNVVSIGQDVVLSDKFATMLDDDVLNLLRTAMHDTRKVIINHKDFIENLAEELVFDVSLSDTEVQELWLSFQTKEE